jgi:hypothetical protein
MRAGLDTFSDKVAKDTAPASFANVSGGLVNFTLESSWFGQTDRLSRLRKYEICADFCVGLACDGLGAVWLKGVFSAPSHGETGFDGLSPLRGSGLMENFPRAYARG